MSAVVVDSGHVRTGWSMAESNRRPPGCDPGALPSELMPRATAKISAGSRRCHPVSPRLRPPCPMGPANLVSAMIDLHNHLLPGSGRRACHIGRTRSRWRVLPWPRASRPWRAPRTWPSSTRIVRARSARGSSVSSWRSAALAFRLRIVAGAEISTELIDRLDDDELRLLSLNDSGWLLVEAPFAGLAGAAAEAHCANWRSAVSGC